MRRKQRGFTLIELLIVISIILIIAAFAFPNFRSILGGADESSAVNSLTRVLNPAMFQYSTRFPQVGYPTSLTQLGPPAGSSAQSSSAAGLINNDLAVAQPRKAGYTFVLNTTSPTTYTINANPDPGSKGARYLFTDESGVVRANMSQPATAADNPI